MYHSMNSSVDDDAMFALRVDGLEDVLESLDKDFVRDCPDVWLGPTPKRQGSDDTTQPLMIAWHRQILCFILTPFLEVKVRASSRKNKVDSVNSSSMVDRRYLLELVGQC